WDPKTGRKDLYKADTPEIFTVGFAPTGHLLYTDRHVWAVPFSLERLEVTGERFRVLENCRAISVADNGTVGFATADREENQPRRLVWVDRKGNILAPVGTAQPGLYGPDLSPDQTKIVYDTFEPGLPGGRLWSFDIGQGFATAISTSGQNA